MRGIDAKSAGIKRLQSLRTQAAQTGKAWQEAQNKVKALESSKSSGTYSTKGLEAATKRVADLEAKMVDGTKRSAAKRAQIEKSLATARERLAVQQGKAESRLSRELERAAKQAGQAKTKFKEAKNSISQLSVEMKQAGIDTQKLNQEQQRLGKTMAMLKTRTDALNKARNAESANRDKRQEHMGNFMSTAAVGMSLAAPVREAMNFEAQMSRVGAVSSATKEQLVALTAEARKQGRATKYTAVEAGQGMEYLAMAGFNATQQVQAIGGVLTVAAAAGADLGRASDIVSNALTGFGLKADQTARVGDVLTKTFTSSNTTLESLGDTLKYVAPVASQAGASIEMVAAMAGVMGDAGIQGSMAGTAMRSMFLRMIDPAKAGQKAMDQMGISASQMRELMANGDLGGGAEQIKRMGISVQDEQGNMRNWMDILTEVNAKMQNMSKGDKLAAASAIAGKHAVSGFLAVLSSLGKAKGEAESKLQQRLFQNQNSQGYSKLVSKKMLDNTKGALTVLGSAMSDLAISIGNVLAPSVRSGAESLTGLANKASELVQQFPLLSKVLFGGIGSVLALSLAASGLGFAWAVLKTPFLRMNTIFRMVRSEMALMRVSTLASGNATSLLGAKWAGFKTQAAGMVTSLRTVALGFWSMLPAIGATTVALLANPITWIVAGIGMAVAGLAVVIHKYWDPIAAYLGGVWDGISAAFVPVIEGVTSALEPLAPIGRAIGSVLGFIGDAIGGIIGWFAELLAPISLTKDEFDSLHSSGQDLGHIIGTVLAGAFSLLTAPLRIVGTVVGGVIGGFQALASFSPLEMISAGWQPVADFFSNLWAGITQVFERSIAWISDKVSWVFDIGKKVGSWFGSWFGSDNEEAKPSPGVSVASGGVTKSSTLVPAPVTAQHVNTQSSSAATTVNAPITVNVPPGQDGQDIAAIIEARLRRLAGESRGSRNTTSAMYD
jgi:TP901 family phage tail tape measure protein